MLPEEIAFCDRCAKALLASWKGWPHRNPVPHLAKLESPTCVNCGGEERLDSFRIRWFNYHSEYSTGLPDYWLLKVDQGSRKWGRPYYAEIACPSCDRVAIVSEMQYPNGGDEMKLNCAQCGVQNLPDEKAPAGGA